MMNHHGRDLFKLLRSVIPDIPEDATKLVLTLEVGSFPVIECRFVVRETARVELRERKYTLTPIDGTPNVR